MKQDEKLLRDCLEVLQCFGQEHNPNVGRTIKKLQERLGDRANEIGADDPYYADALQFVLSTGRCSMEIMLREFWIGYRRIAHIQKALEDAGVILPHGEGLNPEYKPNLKVVNK